ncbi:hypothetical protein N7486_001196 [Penicillium sp. IBT 16267x]|nr:hypothetical protein N7486_001196 [Penicillium sp. IBT 16267x]
MYNVRGFPPSLLAPPYDARLVTPGFMMIVVEHKPNGQCNGHKHNYQQILGYDHGYQGVLRTIYAKGWEQDLSHVLDQLEEAGLELNLDHNSGNPLGMGITINSAGNGRRITAVDLLIGTPDNLVFVMDTPIQRVVLQDKKAFSVETKGKKYLISKEVMISSGSLDAPKILMNSVIGSASELSKFNIPVIEDLPAVGQDPKGRFVAPLILLRNTDKNHRNNFYGSESVMDNTHTMGERRHRTLDPRRCQIGCGWLRSDQVTSLQEFKDFPAPVQDFMNKETITLFQDYSYICLIAFLMKEQSTGEVLLQSSNPDDPLLFDPKFLQHPFDQRAMVEIYKHHLEVIRYPSFAKETVSTLFVPASEGDEDILQFFKANTSSRWHITGTVKMTNEGDINAAVDNRFGS